MNPVQRDVPLKDFSTFKIGGPAKYFIEADTPEALSQSLTYAKQNRLPFFILGKGSNCLFDDRGFDGLVILNKIALCEFLESGLVRVGAGYSFSLLGAQTAKKGLSGLEFASGIPGSVGGAVFMNAGANGSETADVIESVEYLLEDGKCLLLNREQISFSYRWSSFQEKKGAILLATFRLKCSEESRSKQLNLIAYRKQTQPLASLSAGCVFRNPEGGFAGQVIEKCGLKGFCIGRAKVSEIHANFIVNTGTATSLEVQELIRFIQKTVKEKAALDLQCEVKMIPYQGLV